MVATAGEEFAEFGVGLWAGVAAEELMQQEREWERQERPRPQREVAAAAERKRTEREALLRELGALFPMANAHQRGLAFERLINQIFKLDGLNVREGFTLSTESGQIGEQIDGLVELGSQPYLVEAKWWKNPLGVDGVAQHLVRVYSRPGVHGLIVSASEFADTTVQQCRHALTQRVIVLAELREIVMLLEHQGNFATWLQANAMKDLGGLTIRPRRRPRRREYG